MSDRTAYLDPKEGEHLPKKQVTAQTRRRLELSADAIAATKRAIQFQGNQIPALIATNMNSRYRLQVMRNPSAWEYTPEARALAAQHKEADVAAKADLANGGNCGEHAWVAFAYLREHATGETINRVAPSYIDHAFAIIGDLETEADNELVVSDPWVNNPTACLWEDFFAKGPRDQVPSSKTMVADGNSYKEAIKAGLRLSSYGQQLVKKADSDEETKRQTTDAQSNLFWDHDDTVAPGRKYHYQAPQTQPTPTPAGRDDEPVHAG
jgi:hypothetical protein